MCSVGLRRPVAMATLAPDLFVANSTGDSMTGVETSTGAFVRVTLRGEMQAER
jgi:hypothetical protein